MWYDCRWLFLEDQFQYLLVDKRIWKMVNLIDRIFAFNWHDYGVLCGGGLIFQFILDNVMWLYV